jgi:hypothetical protein
MYATLDMGLTKHSPLQETNYSLARVQKDVKRGVVMYSMRQILVITGLVRRWEKYWLE